MLSGEGNENDRPKASLKVMLHGTIHKDDF